MPELPEVETVRLQLLHKIRGKTIAKIIVLHPKTVNHHLKISAQLSGLVVDTIDRIGKLLIFSFVGQTDLFLLAHLKMTGQFFYVDADGVVGGGHSVTATDLNLPGRHTRVTFHFTDQSSLFFNDMRLFGYLKLATAAEVAAARAKFGPEPITDSFDCAWFAKSLKVRKSKIKALLLDQSFVAGLGNIYVDEALWRAKIRPTRLANTVTKKEAATLCASIRDILQESIAMGGTTFQHFVDTDGEKGNFTKQLKIFGKQGTPCQCGTIIRKIRCAGRGTHYCPKCQR
ncbi:bifunctional DNA-formamidopyrimidine glycosylase/DNA-(apurinic or apyrimidinic site) lyase [Candidatus Kaiserbacteria bacterium]|nr:bifunctional DNA-formamidopyrimidine glycosylase/DNA-(apurinic or apyrimidinic site) lyase [Candidatus Kaiserbacteria bacterium]NCT02200.1 bifunctional DNA-formamidopyrimidine glycosylase/DNA-(apurinic or apyrimidinic site) lyase [Candidatus Parcubacteria bacterium]